MEARHLHDWTVSYDEAVRLQETLRAKLRLVRLPSGVRLVAGADAAYDRITHRMYAAVVVLKTPEGEVVETAESVEPAVFPYIPGLLSFRELPPLINAFSRLRTDPDVLMFDGQGLAHPRGFGLACHAGVLFDRPSIGCAKSRLVGEHGRLGIRRGARTALTWRGATVGAVVRTRAGVKPVYVSPGHRTTIASAVELVLALTGRFRLPEPIRLAHQATTALRRREAAPLEPHGHAYPAFVKG